MLESSLQVGQTAKKLEFKQIVTVWPDVTFYYNFFTLYDLNHITKYNISHHKKSQAIETTSTQKLYIINQYISFWFLLDVVCNKQISFNTFRAPCHSFRLQLRQYHWINFFLSTLLLNILFLLLKDATWRLSRSQEVHSVAGLQYHFYQTNT